MGCGTMCIAKPVIHPDNKESYRPSIAAGVTPSISRKVTFSSKRSGVEVKKFNILCWCEDAATLARIRASPYSIKILPDGVKVHLTYMTEQSLPSICDCVLYFITQMSQLLEARKFRSRYRLIWSHFVICDLEESRLVQEELNAECLTEDVVALKLIDTSSKMMQLLKRVFDSIDVDHSGSVDVIELQKATAKVSSEFSNEEIVESIEAMDTNKNGIIEYAEFVDWWRSGRQSAYKLSTLVESISKSLAEQVPEAMKMLKSMRSSRLLTKDMSHKQLNIGIGNVSSAPNLTWRLEFGTAARRELLLYDALEVFRWLSKDHCMILSFKTIEGLDEAHLMNLITSTVELAIGLLKERTFIRESIDYQVIVEESTLYIGLTIDLSQAFFSPLLKHLTPWQKLLEAPVDQLLSILFRSETLDNLNNSFLNINIEHWSKLPLYLLKIIWTFLGRIGLDHLEPVLSQSKDASLTMNFASTDELQKSWIVEKLEFLNTHIHQFSTDFTTVRSLYTELTEHAAPDFDVYLRIDNLGIRSSFVSSSWPSSLQFLSL